MAPNFSSSDGQALLSWIERSEDSARVRFARYGSATGWSDPITIVERSDLFVNWADFPSLIADDSGTLYAHWLQKSAPATYAYDVTMSVSGDGGETWSEPFVLHDDGTPTEHGFASMSPHPDGGIAVTWLDGREMGSGGHGHGGGDMTIRWARVDPDGTVRESRVIDERTCECCTTGMAITGDTSVIAWRDRSDEEVRDIAVARVERGGSVSEAIFFDDGWTINACPVNGPQVSASENALAVAWYTEADGDPRVNVAFSADGGRTFGDPIRVDERSPLGRVDVEMISDDEAVVTWLEENGKGAAIMARSVTSRGAPGPSRVIRSTDAGRTSGFPRATVADGFLWLALTVPGGEPAVEIFRARLKNGATDLSEDSEASVRANQRIDRSVIVAENR